MLRTPFNFESTQKQTKLEGGAKTKEIDVTDRQIDNYNDTKREFTW